MSSFDEFRTETQNRGNHTILLGQEGIGEKTYPHLITVIEDIRQFVLGIYSPQVRYLRVRVKTTSGDQMTGMFLHGRLSRCMRKFFIMVGY